MAGLALVILAICCSTCKDSLKRDVAPSFRIANNYAIGVAPACLQELTEFERAFLSPVKMLGFCFFCRWEATESEGVPVVLSREGGVAG